MFGSERRVLNCVNPVNAAKPMPSREMAEGSGADEAGVMKSGVQSIAAVGSDAFTRRGSYSMEMDGTPHERGRVLLLMIQAFAWPIERIRETLKTIGLMARAQSSGARSCIFLRWDMENKFSCIVAVERARARGFG
jgi:hypothetical protein